MCSAPRAAAAADDLRALLAPAERHPRVLRAADAGVEAPARVGEVAEVGIDAERQVGEVAQVGDHPLDVVGRDAVDEQRADAHLLEAARGAAELVALRAAPVLAVDAAHAVAAAPERQPHRQADPDELLDRLEQRGSQDGQRLDQHEVGLYRLVGEQARQEAERLAPVGRVHVGVQRERDRGLAGPARLLHRGGRQPQAAPRDVHPVHGRARVVPEPRPVGGERRREPPRVRRQHVAARARVAAVHVEDEVGRVDQRARAPQPLVARSPADARELRADGAVEDDGAAVGDPRGGARVRG